eukprot:TRINITY_DN5616_c0_g1_i1.p2 TRINITY_DN5616_c0_g1~~TRINITY_DN5616_c0_g1_i1.p2  ORF type:complete len:122 (+),score=6.42 TRINITY_DN5616_c0_g1_i1:251-616(+)
MCFQKKKAWGHHPPACPPPIKHTKHLHQDNRGGVFMIISALQLYYSIFGIVIDVFFCGVAVLLLTNCKQLATCVQKGNIPNEQCEVIQFWDHALSVYFDVNVVKLWMMAFLVKAKKNGTES